MREIFFIFYFRGIEKYKCENLDLFFFCSDSNLNLKFYSISNSVGTFKIADKGWKFHKLHTVKSWLTLEYGFLNERGIVTG